MYFIVTYDIVTPESAEQGDSVESGFVTPRGGHFEVEQEQAAMITQYGEPGWRQHWPPQEVRLSLREALDLVSCCEDGGSSFYECDGREDYHTGEHENRALHAFGGITGASYNRIKRLVCR